MLNLSDDTSGGFSANSILQMVDATQKALKAQMDALSNSNSDNIDVTQMFRVQLLANQMSQVSEAASNVISTANSAISTAARNIK